MTKPAMVLVADVHIHPHSYANHYDDGDPIGLRVRVTKRVLEETLQKARACGVPWICLGDLIHTGDRVATEVLSALTDLFTRYGDVQKILLLGNHEKPSRWARMSSLDWLVELPNTQLMSDCTVMNISGFNCFFLPHNYDHAVEADYLRKKVEEVLATDEANTPRLLFGHGVVDGAKLPGGVRLSNPAWTVDSLWMQAFNAVYFGDIHHPATFGKNGRYVGCLHPQSFSDGEGGYIVLNTDLSYAEIPTDVTFRYKSEEVLDAVNTTAGGVVFQKRDPRSIQRTTTKGAIASLDFNNTEALVKRFIEENPPPADVNADEAASLYLRSW